MLPTYFHRYYIRYIEHNNAIWYRKFSATKRCFSTQLLPWVIFPSYEQEPECYPHRNLHLWRWPTVAVTTSEMHHLPPHCVHIHYLDPIKVWQVSMNVSGSNFFSVWRNSILHFCSIHAPMSDSILSGCTSAATCHMVTACNRILVRRFNLHCQTTNTCLWHSGPTW